MNVQVMFPGMMINRLIRQEIMTGRAIRLRQEMRGMMTDRAILLHPGMSARMSDQAIRRHPGMSEVMTDLVNLHRRGKKGHRKDQVTTLRQGLMTGQAIPPAGVILHPEAEARLHHPEIIPHPGAILPAAPALREEVKRNFSTRLFVYKLYLHINLS